MAFSWGMSRRGLDYREHLLMAESRSFSSSSYFTKQSMEESWYFSSDLTKHTVVKSWFISTMAVSWFFYSPELTVVGEL